MAVKDWGAKPEGTGPPAGANAVVDVVEVAAPVVVETMWGAVTVAGLEAPAACVDTPTAEVELGGLERWEDWVISTTAAITTSRATIAAAPIRRLLGPSRAASGSSSLMTV